MKDLKALLKDSKGQTLLAIFPHADDECFVAGGLFQIAKEVELKTKLLCLTRGERGINGLGRGKLKKIRTKELDKAVMILGIDKLILEEYPDAKLRETKAKWTPIVTEVIKKESPDIVLTFDHSGVTGHPDHIVSCHEVLKILRKIKKKPVLLWRVPDTQEKSFFAENRALKFASKPNYHLSYGLKESLIKIRAIFAHNSQMQGVLYRLQILEWFLFDHKELYFRVDYKKKYNYRFVPYKID
ncbi:PIG-L family deacetylase [Patescibacteria group bacterium]|nr:PIG-L family deacetylase [Patescibacteria group bacterium]